jgi:hypothetical protein
MIPADAEPESTPSGISPFAPPTRAHRRGPAGPRLPRSEITVPLPRYRDTGPAPLSVPGQPPAGLGPSAPVTDTWAEYYDQYDRRARYRWIGTIGGLLVLAAVSAGTFWLLRAGGVEPAAGTRVSAYGLSYRLPPSWNPRSRADLPWARELLAQGLGAGPEFECGGQRRARAQSGVILVHRTDGHPPTPADAAIALGRSFAHTMYGDDASVAEVESEGPPLRVPGASARFAAVPPAGATCPVSGLIDVVALPGGGSNPTVRVFLFQHDTAGGPPKPAPPSTREVRAVLASLSETTSIPH